ncbi:MAG: hypothetical protein J1E80_00515 [Desulfovibrionaceae bacterium]|nr:hypothetical protein [Desulfovibrionaceae bacterium]
MADAAYIGENTDVVLGREFLTWLWFRSETSNGLFRMGTQSGHEGEPFSVNIEQRVVVRGGEGQNLEMASVSGSLSPLREARLGLQTGKLVVRALVRLEKDGLAWQVTLKAEDLGLGSLRTPAIARNDEGDDPDALFLEKMYLIESSLDMLDDLYRQFLELRLAPAWEAEAAAVADWMRHDISQGAM